MKSIQAEYYLLGTEKLNPDPEETIVLYGNENMYNYMEELAQILSSLAPNRLYALGQLYTHDEESYIITAFLNGEEINIAEDGSYFMIDGDSLFKLVDTEEGLRLECESHEIYEEF